MATTEKMGVQNLRDTAATLATKQTVLKSGELFYVTDKDRTKIGNGSAKGSDRPHFLDSNHEKYIERLDCIYGGKDLTQVHAAEIAGYSDVWAWVQARITAGNFDGIHVGDYIPFQLSAGTITDGSTSYAIAAKTMYAQVVGIDTYYKYGWSIPANNNATRQDAHHIDFITTKTIGTIIPFNPTDNNNGTADNNNPWLSSKIYAILNGLNNYTTNAYNNVPHGYNASSGGVLQLLPQALQNVIKMKTLRVGKKYSASGLMTNHTGDMDFWGIGKLWLPTEKEVYGSPLHSANKGSDGRDLANINPVQYPLFAGSASLRNNYWKDDTSWWLSSVCGGSSSYACYVNNNGIAYAIGCAHTYVSVPVCFRI